MSAPFAPPPTCTNMSSKQTVPTSSQWSGLAKLVLGSKSWSRRTLLSELQVPPFEIVTPDIDESSIRHPSAVKLVLALGNAKARAIIDRNVIELPSEKLGKTLLICGDSVVRHKGMILEKPNNYDQAKQYLNSYATAPATTVSSIIVVDVARKWKWQGVDEAEVYFRKMPENVIDELVKNGGAMESAGGLRIEHPLAVKYTECIVGDKSAVMGFSQPLVRQLIHQALEGKGGASVDTENEE